MTRRVLISIAVAAGLVVPAAATAAPRTVTVSEETASVSWDGAPTPAFNPTFFDARLGAKCGSAPTDYCDDTLVHFTGEGPYEDSNLTFGIGGFAQSDYDLRVYTSDETGAVGDHLGNGDGDGAGPFGAVITTFVGDGETLSTAAEPDSWYLVRVVYFTVPGHEGYKGTVSWAGTPATAPEGLPAGGPAAP